MAEVVGSKTTGSGFFIHSVTFTFPLQMQEIQISTHKDPNQKNRLIFVRRKHMSAYGTCWFQRSDSIESENECIYV
jgi:hypothetical protein